MSLRAIKNAVTFTSVLLMFTLVANGQMRKMYLDETTNDNHVLKPSFYTANEGFVAFTKWIGYSTDSGRTFSKKFITNSNVNFNGYSVNLTFGFGISGVKAFAQNNILVYGDYGFVPAILSSTDGGNTFKLIYHSQFNPFDLSTGITDMVFPNNESIGYAIDADRILKTTDQGLSWSTLRTAPNSFFEKIIAPDYYNVYALSTYQNTNKLVKTGYDGTTFQTITVPTLPQGKLTGMFFLTESTGWLSMLDGDNNGYIFKTVTGGGSWNQQNDLMATPFSSYFLSFKDENIGYALDGGRVYRTDNSGASWEPFIKDNNLEYQHYDLQIQSANQFWAGGQHGFLEQNTNAKSGTLPRAYFKIDTSTLFNNGTVQLQNYSKAGYTYKWLLNKVQISTSYNSSYLHVSGNMRDTIQLIVSNGNTSDTAIHYQDFHPLLKITDFNPKSAATGAEIIINGISFIGVNQVSFGGIQAANFSVLNETTIRAIIGAGMSGKVKVVAGTGSDSLSGFSYISKLPAPIISSFSPMAEEEDGIITIIGSYFDTTIAVTIGNIPAKSFIIESPRKILAAVPRGSSGNVSVTTTSGNNSFPGFTFLPSISIKPVIHSITPEWGNVDSIVSISGNNFGQGTEENTVFFGSIKAKVISATNSLITVKVPKGAITAPIKITTNGRQCFSIRPFKILFNSRIGSFYPDMLTLKEFELGSEQTYGRLINSADFDSDGKADVVLLKEPYNFLTVLKNTSHAGTTTFSAPHLFALDQPETPTNMEVADINGDNKPDITLSGFPSDSLIILVNTSGSNNISFSTPIKFKVPIKHGIWSTFFIEDIDNDGRPDIVTGAPVLTVIRNLTNDGIVKFGGPITFPYYGGIHCTAGDFNGDGKKDIVLNGYNNKIGILQNTSTPNNISFAPEINFIVSSTILEGLPKLTISDINVDNKEDIYFHIGADYWLLTNSGTGNNINFSLSNGLAYGSGLTHDNTWTDLDGDGKPDRIINQGLSKNRSNGNQLIVDEELWMTPEVAGIRVVEDFNLDGRPDLAFNFFRSKFLSICQNDLDQPFPIELCPNGSTIINSRISQPSANYQWQISVDNGKTFTNLTDNSNYSGTQTASLYLSQMPSSTYGYQYRCKVGIEEDFAFSLKFTNQLIGGFDIVEWGNTSSWNCGILPDANTDVIINYDTKINVDAVCRSLKVISGAHLTIESGRKLTITK